MSSSANVNGGNPPAFLDDVDRAAAVNGQPATASLVGREIALANQIANSGRPIFSWYGANGQGQPPGVDHTSTFRQIYLAANLAASTEAGLMMGMHHDEPGSPPGFLTGQGFRVRLGTTDYNTYWNTTVATATTWPVDMNTFMLNSSFGKSATPTELTIGSVTDNYPQPKAGTYWQNPADRVDATSSAYAGSQDVRAAGDIVGVKSGSVENISTLVTIFRDTWLHQRPQVGWSLEAPGQFSSLIRAANMSTSSQQYRYVFDQTYGVGGNTFVNGGPAITLPLLNSAAGLRTQVRVYVFVYAAMSGVTNTGSIAVSNKTAHNTVAGTPVAPTNPVTISGNTFQWYPDPSTWTPSTGMYFLGWAGDTFDRVALCAKASGLAPDTVRIGAFTFIVAPATS